MTVDNTLLNLLKNRITLDQIPFVERESRLMLFRREDAFWIGLAQYEVTLDQSVLVDAIQITAPDGRVLGLETTTYPHRVDCDTTSGRFTWAFAGVDSLVLVLPAGRHGFTFWVRGGTLERRTAQGCSLALRSTEAHRLEYRTDAFVVHQEIVDREDGVQVSFVLEAAENDVLCFSTLPGPESGCSLPAPLPLLEEAARRWQAWFAAVPEVDDQYRAQYYYAWWIMAINLIRPRFCPQFEAMVPSRNGYLGIWHWDAYFHALGYRHVDPKLAQDQVRIMLAHQLEDGMIPDVVHDEGILAFVSEAPYRHVSSGLKGPEPPPRTYGITKPPLTAWTAWKLYEIDGDADFLASVYDAIVRAQAWWIEQRDSDRNGLCEYHHRYSSGLDDSPLWDGGLPVESPDLNAYLCMQYDDLARIARVIGREEDVPQWESRASRLAECLTEAMWDSEAGLFRATRAGQPIATRTPFNLYPLITGRLPAPIADRVVATLTDPRQFWGTYPVPTVALDDPAFDPLVMWRGPVWINPNYLLVDGLLRAGYAGLARTLRQRTLDLMMRHADFYEFYHPITAEKPPHASNMFGWSAALFIDLAITESADAAQQGG